MIVCVNDFFWVYGLLYWGLEKVWYIYKCNLNMKNFVKDKLMKKKKKVWRKIEVFLIYINKYKIIKFGGVYLIFG